MATTDIDIIQGGAQSLAALGVRATATELIIPAQLPVEQWLQLMDGLGGIVQASAWYVGDGIIHGEAAYGEMYSQAVDRLGLAEQTLTNYVYTCRHVPPDVRRPELSFGHHSAVASLEPDQQQSWLTQAVTNGWSRTELREAIKEAGLGRPQLPKAQPTPGHDAAVRVVDEAAAQVRSNGADPNVGADAELLQLPTGTQLVQVADLARQVCDAGLPVADVPQQLAATFVAVPGGLLTQLGTSLLALDSAAAAPVGVGGPDELVPSDDHPCTNVPPCAFVAASQEELWQHLREEHGWQ